ncbi:hypothetical protein COW38_00380 [Candidatus Collierbacteria bacterium CG17_big_fil_post_rev_8_21_14_2_50_45_7]|uniref:DUF86 domain-containing protein n=2 Tax=Candidatus Collieribacteriota TaxID=1752725 RepID=A0A2H0WYI3_9BACT|nr:MAG: hypothetical protein COT54_03415 [Candidatus Collierbacteria bacterium CG09_land_8_20_14_0_10_46_12]PIW08625.1 MAG: hypothetical protein COW38_00380 [Candidatus Collierbacteria bacterium CG17_big_fil_post_rev_8_21_14_2_50_45_7]
MIKDVKVYLSDILDSITLIESYMSGIDYDHFLINRQVQDAVVKRFEVIGEAVKRLDKDFRDIHPELPWKGMIGLRDILVHDYDKVILEELWKLINNGDLQSVKEQVIKVLANI